MRLVPERLRFNPQLLKKGIVIVASNDNGGKVMRFNSQLLKKGIVIGFVDFCLGNLGCFNPQLLKKGIVILILPLILPHTYKFQSSTP